MASPNSTPITKMGRKLTTGPSEMPGKRLSAQPHSKTITTAPSAAPTESR